MRIAPILIGTGIVYLIGREFFKTGEQIRWDITDVAIDTKKTSIASGSLYGTAVLQIVNPRNLPIKVTGIVLDILYKGKSIGRITNLQNTIIQPKAVTRITLPFQFSFINLGQTFGTALADLLKNKANPVFQFKGPVNYTGGTIDIDETRIVGIR